MLEGERDATAAVVRAINRVDLKRGGIRIPFDLAPLLFYELDNPRARLTIARFVPLQLKRRGVELRIVMVGEAASNSAIDPTLLKAVARGHRWFSELASYRIANTREIAQREGLHDSYVRRLISYAFLVPSIVQAICEGRQPADPTTERLTRRATLPHQ